MTFGLHVAPATSERLVERVLEGLHWRSTFVYLDSIVFGRMFQQQMERLAEAFNRFREEHLRLSREKCCHVVCKRELATNPQRKQAVRDWPVPINMVEVSSFLRLCYHRSTSTQPDGEGTESRANPEVSGSHLIAEGPSNECTGTGVP